MLSLLAVRNGLLFKNKSIVEASHLRSALWLSLCVFSDRGQQFVEGVGE